MIAYLDSSVLLRIILGQADQVPCFRELTGAVCSALARVECLRTLERARLAGLSDEEVAVRRVTTARLLEGVELVEVTAEVLERAADPFPTTLGTLDAIHLSTALLWQRSQPRPLDALLTHDAALGRTARAMGLRVHGA